MSGIGARPVHLRFLHKVDEEALAVIGNWIDSL